MACAALMWTSDDIRVLTNSGEFRLRRAISPDNRYSLRLWSDFAGRLYLRVVQDRQPFMISFDSGITFEPVPPIPGEGAPISAFHCKVHPALGVITVLETGILWMYDVTTRQWQTRELPSDIHVNDVSLDEQGGLWCAGSADSRRIPSEETEAAVRYQTARGVVFQSLSLRRLGPISSARVINEGGLAELRTIDAESEPIIGTSICSWLLDDSSSFVFIFYPNRTYVRRLKGEMICHIDRPRRATVRVFTYEGSVWQGIGTGLKRYSVVAAIESALIIRKRRILIRGLDTRGEKIVAAVEVTPLGANDIAQEPEFTAVCMSADGGKSFDVIQRLTFKNGGEIQDVAWLPEQ
jgi:hypothetical protein